MADFLIGALVLGALIMFGESSDTNYLVCGAVLMAAAYLKGNGNVRHDKLVEALIDIADRSRR